MMFPPPIDDDERVQLDWAQQEIERNPALTVSEESLRELTAAKGIDAATAIAYQHVRRLHRDFINRIESTPPPAPSADMRLLVVPGAFHREYAHTGAGGERIMEIAESLGWRVDRLDLPSLAPMAENGGKIAADLMANATPTVIASLSKGSADVRAVLEGPNADAALKHVRGWLSLSGIVTGTPLVGWFRARPLRCAGVRILLRLRRQRFAVIDELRRGPDSPLGKRMVAPEHLQIAHVIGFPMRRHLASAWAQRGHDRLADLGPNDGGGNLLCEAARLVGHVYPVWGADHYLRPVWDIRPLLTRILQELAAPDEQIDDDRQG